MFAQVRIALGNYLPNRVVNTTLLPFTSTRSISILENLTPPEGSKNRTRRLGRGPGSGLGKTSGRGQKGQKARSSIPNWFEGGQTPYYKLFPKRGFFRHQKLVLNDVPLMRIQQFYEQGKIPLKEGEVLTMRKMKEFGIITGPMNDGVSIVGTGKQIYNTPIAIEATKATGPAIEAIERAGGSFTARYFSKSICFRAHHSPNWFMEKRGYLPIQAKPIARRDILNYSNPDKRGYLVGSEYIEKINESISGRSVRSVVTEKRTPLIGELEKYQSTIDQTTKSSISNGSSSFKSNQIIDLKSLQL